MIIRDLFSSGGNNALSTSERFSSPKDKKHKSKSSPKRLYKMAKKEEKKWANDPTSESDLEATRYMSP
uniref:Uncharacterized protein n=1 Tax=Oryza brachyantha TaxID=4533 RepID=J3N388_ORYBR